MKSTIIAALMFAALAISAQTRAFRWDDELCQYEGRYDAKKITAAKLRATLNLAGSAGFPFETNTTVWDIPDIPKLDVTALDREYTRKAAELKALDIVRSPYWEDLRQRKLREMDKVYRLNRTTMRAYEDQKILLEYKDAPACSSRYAAALISGGDDLLNVWREVNEDSRKNNGAPERLRRIYEEQLRSADRMKYALIEVMAFGWSNCANQLIDYVEDDGTQEKEFKKLFKKVRTIHCSEP